MYHCSANCSTSSLRSPQEPQEEPQLFAKLIEPKTSSVYAWNSKPFKFTDLSQIPIDLEDIQVGETCIITCWDTNVYIKLQEENRFVVTDSYGQPLKLNQEYILIRPSY